jgi:hypothetical protein
MLVNVTGTPRYFPALRMGLSKRFAIYASFLFSAVFHEVLISIHFHTIRPYAFLGTS